MSLWADSSSMSSLCLKCPFAQGQIVLSLSSSSVHSFEEVTNEIPSPSATAFRSLSNLVFRSRVRLQCMLALNSITFKLEFNAYLTYSSPHRLKTLSCPRSIYRSSLLPFVFSPSSSNDNDTPPTLNILGQQHYSLAILLAD